MTTYRGAEPETEKNDNKHKRCSKAELQDEQQKPRQPHEDQGNKNHTSSSSLRLEPLVDIEN